ncbi:hypothetical protein D3C87_1649490 [compost metagenome]
MRTNGGTCSNMRPAFDHHKCPDTCARINHSVRRNYRRRMNTGGRFGLGIEQVRNTSVGGVRIRYYQCIAVKTFSVSGLEQQGCRLAACQELAVLGVCQKAQLSWASLLQGG